MRNAIRVAVALNKAPLEQRRGTGWSTTPCGVSEGIARFQASMGAGTLASRGFRIPKRLCVSNRGCKAAYANFPTQSSSACSRSFVDAARGALVVGSVVRRVRRRPSGTRSGYPTPWSRKFAMRPRRLCRRSSTHPVGHLVNGSIFVSQPGQWPKGKWQRQVCFPPDLDQLASY